MLRSTILQQLNIVKVHYASLSLFTAAKAKPFDIRLENERKSAAVGCKYFCSHQSAVFDEVKNASGRKLDNLNYLSSNDQRNSTNTMFLKGDANLLPGRPQRRSFCSLPPIIEKKVEVGGLNINFVQSGKGPNGVLLMPGAVGSAWTDFKPQIEKLPKVLPNHTIIAWDPPGYGKSIPPNRKFDLDFFRTDAECAKNLMNTLGFPKFSILGWSDGGITALILSGKHQNAVNKLVIWGAGAYINEAEAKAIEAIRDISKWSQRMREPMEKLYGPERFPQLWSEWVDAEVAFFKERNGDFCKEEVEKIVAPTLIVHGKKDPMVAAEHIPYLRERIKGCKYYEFPEGKHNIHLRYADEFNKIVAEFLLE